MSLLLQLFKSFFYVEALVPYILLMPEGIHITAVASTNTLRDSLLRCNTDGLSVILPRFMF